MVPWSYESKVLAEHPEMVTIDRRGNKYWMVPEYGYPEVRQAEGGRVRLHGEKVRHQTLHRQHAQ